MAIHGGQRARPMEFGVVFGGVRVDILPSMPPPAHAAFRRLISEIGTVDAVGVDERVAKYTTRSIKKGAKLFGLKLAVSMLDLTTLEGKDTPGKVESLCRKAVRPHDDPDIPPVAAVKTQRGLRRRDRRGHGGPQRSPMNRSSRCWCWVLQRLVRWA